MLNPDLASFLPRLPGRVLPFAVRSFPVLGFGRMDPDPNIDHAAKRSATNLDTMGPGSLRDKIQQRQPSNGKTNMCNSVGGREDVAAGRNSPSPTDAECRNSPAHTAALVAATSHRDSALANLDRWGTYKKAGRSTLLLVSFPNSHNTFGLPLALGPRLRVTLHSLF